MEREPVQLKMRGPLTETDMLCIGKARSLSKISSLDLSRRSISHIDTEVYNQLTGLESLDLSLNALTIIPDDLHLPMLRVLDISDNELTSVDNIGNFSNLEQLYIGDNDVLTIDDYYIAKCLCPLLTSIDGAEDVRHIEKGISLYRSRLEPQILAVWEAKFSEVYSKGIDKEEINSLHSEFVDTIHKAEIVGSSLTMPKFRNFMINRLCMQIIENINSGKSVSSGRGSDRTPSRYGTRVAKGTTPVKNYSSGVPVSTEDIEVSSSPVNVKKRKREDTDDISPLKSPAAKRKKDNVRTPVFTKLMKSDDMTTTQLPSLPDYDPFLFLRCHSMKNDPADHSTKVWQCAFEPSIDNPGETTNILASCGGQNVCFIDCQTGKVMKRYKSTSKSESFYTLAWTTLPADGKQLKEDVNILAVAGQNEVINLIHPTQLVMFGTLHGHKGYISSLVFHPNRPNILFSGSRDNKVIMWEIGSPDFKDYSITWRQKAVLALPGTDAITLVVNDELDILIAGCEESCFAWKLEKLYNKEKSVNVQADYEFIHPRQELDEQVVVDGLALLSNNCIVSKCVDHDRLYVWDLKSHMQTSNKRSRTLEVPVTPFVQLKYQATDVDYLYLNTTKDILSAGDNKGNIYMYDLKSVTKKKRRNDELLLPSQTLEYPDTMVDKSYSDKMEDVSNNKDVVVNCVRQSSSREYIVCGTDNNLICVWKQQ